MTDVYTALRYAAASVLIGGGLLGTVAALLGIETISAAYFAAAIAAGAGALPESGERCRRIRNRLPV